MDSSERPFRELDNTEYIGLVLLLVGEHARFLGDCYKVLGCWDGLNRQGVGRWGDKRVHPTHQASEDMGNPENVMCLESRETFCCIGP